MRAACTKGIGHLWKTSLMRQARCACVDGFEICGADGCRGLDTAKVETGRRAGQIGETAKDVVREKHVGIDEIVALGMAAEVVLGAMGDAEIGGVLHLEALLPLFGRSIVCVGRFVDTWRHYAKAARAGSRSVCGEGREDGCSCKSWMNPPAVQCREVGSAGKEGRRGAPGWMPGYEQMRASGGGLMVVVMMMLLMKIDGEAKVSCPVPTRNGRGQPSCDSASCEGELEPGQARQALNEMSGRAGERPGGRREGAKRARGRQRD